MVSKASEDLPEPERPVNTTSLSRGISTSMFLRLCSRAPRMVIARKLDADCWRRAFRISSITILWAILSLEDLGAQDTHLRLRLADCRDRTTLYLVLERRKNGRRIPVLSRAHQRFCG